MKRVKMYYGKSEIEVLPQKVEEMKAKGWKTETNKQMKEVSK